MLPDWQGALFHIAIKGPRLKEALLSLAYGFQCHLGYLQLRQKEESIGEWMLGGFNR